MANSYLIKGGTVVSVDDKIGTQSDCDILVENGTITAVGQALSAPNGVPVIDATECIVSPGLIDTHRHAWQSQLKNITSNMLLIDYFLYIRNIYGSCYTAHDAYLGELLGPLESIDAGVTFMIDHSHIMNSPEHSDAVVKAFKDSHIRGVFCYGLYVNLNWDGVAPATVTASTEPDWRYADAKRVREQHFSAENGRSDLVRFGFAPAEVERASHAQSIREVEFGRQLDAATITGHLAFGQYDSGYQFIRALYEQKLLGPDLLFSHCSALTDEELRMAKDAGVTFSVTPDTEMQMGMSPCLTPRAEAAGCKHSLGIDVACNNPVDMIQQMRLLLQSERNTRHLAAGSAPNAVSVRCEEVLRLATMGGAECVGLQDMIGSVTPGKKADLILIKTTSPRLTLVHDPVAALVLYANVSDVDTVLIDGRIVKKDGKFTEFDWKTLRKEFLQSTMDIMERSKAAPINDIKRAIGVLINTEDQ